MTTQEHVRGGFYHAFGELGDWNVQRDEMIKSKLRREASQFVNQALADGRDYAVRVYEELKEQETSTRFYIHAQVLLRDAATAEPYDAVVFEAFGSLYTLHPPLRIERGGKLAFALGQDPETGVRFWRKLP